MKALGTWQIGAILLGGWQALLSWLLLSDMQKILAGRVLIYCCTHSAGLCGIVLLELVQG